MSRADLVADLAKMVNADMQQGQVERPMRAACN